MEDKIFVSFASADRKVATDICTELETRGFRCWISSRDVGGGGNYQEEIARAIFSAKVMVLVFTARTNDSDEIKKELALASQSRIVVIPLRVEDVQPNYALKYEFATRQWIDLFEDREHSIQVLSDRIARIVTAEPRASQDTSEKATGKPTVESRRGAPSPEAKAAWRRRRQQLLKP